MARSDIPQKALVKGDRGADVELLHGYLKRFGYFPNKNLKAFAHWRPALPAGPADLSEFDETTEKALLMFQQAHGLSQDGQLNPETLALMQLPRCGCPDTIPAAGSTSLVGDTPFAEFVLQGNVWKKTNLTFSYINFPKELEKATARATLRAAFDRWAAVSTLSFTEIPLGGDIRIAWFSGGHLNDGDAFDGLGGVLAHAFYPPPPLSGGDPESPGDVHFDQAEVWSVDWPPSGFDLLSVALHEIGHTLGLDHSADTTAVMFAAYGPKRELTVDDLQGIHKLYGIFESPNLVVQGFGNNTGGWLVDRHPRLLADLTGDGRADIVGFGNAGVWASLNHGDGTFQAPQMVVPGFGYGAGSWRVDQHPRFLADLTGDGRADIVGFGNAGVWVALNHGNGTFQAPQMVVQGFGYSAGTWRVDKHPRLLADLTGDGRADIVGFGDAGVWVALNHGNGTFQVPQLVLQSFGYNTGSWRVDQHPRFLADLTGSGSADIVGFGNAGVWVSLNNGNGTFQAPQKVLQSFGYNAGSWRVDKHPRLLADLTGNGRADIVGFGDDGVWVALSKGDGTFEEPKLAISSFGYNLGGWRVDRHPRVLADTSGDGLLDIVGFGNNGVWVARGNGDGTFQTPRLVVPNFGYKAGGWRVDRHPRFVARINGDNKADIVGFGNPGVWVTLAR